MDGYPRRMPAGLFSGGYPVLVSHGGFRHRTHFCGLPFIGRNRHAVPYGVTRRSGAVDFSQGDTKDIGVYSMLFDVLPFTQGYAIRTVNRYLNTFHEKGSRDENNRLYPDL